MIEVSGIVNWDVDQTAGLKFLDECIDATDAHPESLGQRILPWKAEIVVPSVTEEERVGRLGADRYGGVAENEIRQLREAMQRNWISTVDLYVLLGHLKVVFDAIHRRCKCIIDLLLPCCGAYQQTTS